MRTLFPTLLLSVMPVFSIAAEPSGCPGMESAAKAYITANFSTDEEKPTTVQQKILHLTARVSVLQIFVPPEAEEKNTTPRPYLAFFSGQNQCDFVQQWDGELAEIMDAGTTKFVLARTEDNESDELHANFQVITVSAKGGVTATRDQHGSEIFFSQTRQNRCKGNIGDITQWVRDDKHSDLIVLRQRHTDRDAKCRVTEDSSTYRYYHLKADHWELDDGGMGE